MYQNNPVTPVNTLPTMYDLPSEDPEEMGWPSAKGVSLEVSSSACPARDKFHDLQPRLLSETCLPNVEDLGQTLRAVGKPPTKWQVYEQILGVPYYAVFDRYSNQFRMFCLQGTKYVELAISNQRFWFNDLKLSLGVWTGTYRGIEGQWLRWYERSGMWVPTEQERELQAKQEG